MEPVNRQQAKSARAREAICRAAISCLKDLGYAETSIQRVVERAELSKGALQYHFRTKEDLIAAVVEVLLGRTLARSYPLRQDTALDPVEIVQRELRAVWTDFINTGAYRALLEILVAARTDEALRTRIEPMLHRYNQQLDQFERESYQSITGDTADVEILLVMNRALMRGLVIQDRYSGDPSYNARIVDRWVELIAPLLRPRHKPKRVDGPVSAQASED